MSTSSVQRMQDTRAIISSVPISSELAAEGWSPQVIFHDPLASNGADKTTQECRQRKPNRLSRKPKYPRNSDRKPVTRMEAIEAVSRDLAILARRASVDAAEPSSLAETRR